MTHDEVRTLLRPLVKAEELWQEGERELIQAHRITREAKSKVDKAQEIMRRFVREYMEPSLFDQFISS